MTDIEKLRNKLTYHMEQVDRIKSAIELLKSIDDVQTVNITDNHQLTIPNSSDLTPKDFDETWTHIKKVAFFFNELGRCAFPREIENLYKKYKLTIKSTMINQILNTMKIKGLVKSYRTPYDAKAHAWGLTQWFNGDKPAAKYSAIKLKSTIWD